MTRMNIIEGIIIIGFTLCGLAVLVGGLPVVRKELDEYQQSDQ